MSASIPWSSSVNADDSHSSHPVKRSHSVENTSPSKKSHTSEHPNSRFSESPQPVSRDNNSDTVDIKPSLTDGVISQSQADGSQTNQNSNQVGFQGVCSWKFGLMSPPSILSDADLHNCCGEEWECASSKSQTFLKVLGPKKPGMWSCYLILNVGTPL